MEVSVLGGGQMARAYRDALERHGAAVASDGDALAPAAVLAFFSGEQTRDFLKNAPIGDTRLLIDLTTQSVADARICQELVQRAGSRYLAGGATGGAREVGTGSFAILLGPVKPGESLPAWLDAIGAVRGFTTVEKAVGAKLLHNFVLVLLNHVLGLALDVAEKSQIAGMVEILAAGTAGRSLRATSVVRDRSSPPCSSYSAELVAKDLRAIAASFPMLAAPDGLDLDRLAACYQSLGQEPYTLVSTVSPGAE